MKLRSLLLSLFLATSARAADPIMFLTDPPQRLDVRFRLFRTENIWNFLELDVMFQ